MIIQYLLRFQQKKKEVVDLTLLEDDVPTATMGDEFEMPSDNEETYDDGDMQNEYIDRSLLHEPVFLEDKLSIVITGVNGMAQNKVHKWIRHLAFPNAAFTHRGKKKEDRKTYAMTRHPEFSKELIDKINSCPLKNLPKNADPAVFAAYHDEEYWPEHKWVEAHKNGENKNLAEEAKKKKENFAKKKKEAEAKEKRQRSLPKKKQGKQTTKKKQGKQATKKKQQKDKTKNVKKASAEKPVKELESFENSAEFKKAFEMWRMANSTGTSTTAPVVEEEDVDEQMETGTGEEEIEEQEGYRETTLISVDLS